MAESWLETITKLKPQLESLTKPAAVIELEEGESPRTANKMLGAAYLSPGESWPRCEFCDNKMTLLVQVAVADIAAVAPCLDPRGLLQIFLCLDKGSASRGGNPCSDLAWKWRDAGRNRLVRVVVPAGESASEVPPATWTEEAYWSYLPPIAMPTSRRIRALVREAERPGVSEFASILWRERGFDLYEAIRCLRSEMFQPPKFDPIKAMFHSIRKPKFGGWPRCLQAPEWPTCEVCDEAMRSLASFSPYETFRIWGDIQVNVFYCETHPEDFAVVYQNT